MSLLAPQLTNTFICSSSTYWECGQWKQTRRGHMTLERSRDMDLIFTCMDSDFLLSFHVYKDIIVVRNLSCIFELNRPAHIFKSYHQLFYIKSSSQYLSIKSLPNPTYTIHLQISSDPQAQDELIYQHQYSSHISPTTSLNNYSIILLIS